MTDKIKTRISLDEISEDSIDSSGTHHLCEMILGRLLCLPCCLQLVLPALQCAHDPRPVRPAIPVPTALSLFAILASALHEQAHALKPGTHVLEPILC